MVSYPPQSEAEIELKEGDVAPCTRSVRMAGTRGPCRGTAARASSPVPGELEAVLVPQGQRCRDPRGAAALRGPSPSRQAAGPTHCGVVCSQDPSWPYFMGADSSTGSSVESVSRQLRASLGLDCSSPHLYLRHHHQTLSMVPWPRSLSARSLRKPPFPAGKVHTVLFGLATTVLPPCFFLHLYCKAAVRLYKNL